MRVLLALTAALACLVPCTAFAQYQNRYLNAAMKLYGDLEYESALESLKKAAAQANSNDAEDVQISLYTGLIQFELGDGNAAESAFKKALAFDENVALPKGVSPKVQAAFDKARKELLKSRPPKPTVQNPPPKTDNTTRPPDKPTDVPKNPDKIVAVVSQPPDAVLPKPVVERKAESGSGKTLGLAIGIPLIAIGAGLIGGGGYFGVQMNQNVADATPKSVSQPETLALLSKANDNARNADIMFGVGGAVALAGVITLVAVLASSSGSEASVPASNDFAH